MSETPVIYFPQADKPTKRGKRRQAAKFSAWMQDNFGPMRRDIQRPDTTGAVTVVRADPARRCYISRTQLVGAEL